MSELPGLPAFGAEPEFGSTEGAYEAVVSSALAHRRRRAATSASATALAVLAVVALSRGPAGSATLRPAGQLPSTPSVTATPGTGGPHVPGDPTSSPTPGAAPSVTASPAPGGPAPSRSTSARPRERWSSITTQVVADAAPGQSCARGNADSDGWCYRYLGPVVARSGAAVTFTAELCRLPGGRSPSRVDFDSADEIIVALQGRDEDGDYVSDHMAQNSHGAPTNHHSRDVAVGACLRWTVTWNGIDDRGEPMPSRGWPYTLTVDVTGTAPRQPLPGDGNPQTVSFWLYHGPFTFQP